MYILGFLKGLSCWSSSQMNSLSNRRLQVVQDGRSSQECRVNAGVPQGTIIGPKLSLLYINNLPDYVICNIGIYADGTTLL